MATRSRKHGIAAMQRDTPPKVSDDAQRTRALAAEVRARAKAAAEAAARAEAEAAAA